VFDEIPHSEKVLKRHQNGDDPCIMAWDHYILSVQLGYFLLGALASLGYWIATRILFSVKVKVLGGWLRPMVG
jgi:hypothetical protein